MGRTLPVPVPCQVCGDKSYGRHYGVYCCDGCSCFFKRSIRKSISYTCISGDGKCVIDKARRNWCPSCRLRKCLSVKMNKQAVQEERGPRKSKKINNDIGMFKLNQVKSRKQPQPKRLTPTTESSSSATEPSSITNRSDLSMTILLSSIHRVMQTPLLRFLNGDAKTALILKIWPQLFVLNASCNAEIRATLDTGSEGPSTLNDSSDTSKSIWQLMAFGSCLTLDVHETHIGSCLLVCLSETNLGMQSGLEDLYCLMLTYHDKTFYSADPLRSTKILYFVNALKSSVSAELVVQKFFNCTVPEIVQNIKRECGR